MLIVYRIKGLGMDYCEMKYYRMNSSSIFLNFRINYLLNDLVSN